MPQFSKHGDGPNKQNRWDKKFEAYELVYEFDFFEEFIHILFVFHFLDYMLLLSNLIRR